MVNPDSVPKLFLATVEKNGAQTALRKKEYGLWRDLSWNDYLQHVRWVALGLISLGFEKGRTAAIIGENSPEWVYADLGIMCAGGVTVGIYTTNAAAQCEYIVADSEAWFYFAENEEQLDKVLGFRERTPHLKKIIVWDMEGLHDFRDPMVMSFDQLLELGREMSSREPDLFQRRVDDTSGEDLAVLIYTSGTTGPPKGAMLTHGNLLWISESLGQVVEVRRRDEFLSFLPLCHIFEQLFTILANLRYGPVVNFIENTDTVTANMREVSPTVSYAVPRIWEKYYSTVMIKMADATWFKRQVFKLALGVGLKHARLKLDFKPIPGYLKLAYGLAYAAIFRKLKKRLGFDRTRIAVSGAAPISPDILIFFHAIGVPLREGYGQTEGSGVTSAARFDHVKIGTVGQPLPGCEVKIAEDGEILVKSPGVFKGYFKNPEATAETLKDGWLHSGDVGVMDEDGFLKITDRKKDLIITAGGKNIAPQFIENQLKFSPYVNDAVVIGDRRKYMTALIVLDEENVAKFAQDNKIPFNTYESLTVNEEIIALIEKEVEKVNNALSRVEQIKRFKILPKKLYEEDGEVTPTMKVKRKYINEAFKDLIESMYR
ncbi:MAG: AMP-binding protein [Thermodesulfobacteriota bacterium]